MENAETITQEAYAAAYQRGYNMTVRFLASRGVADDKAQEAAQAAWAKGWERREKLRNPKMVITWVNSIALNLVRNWMRREKRNEELPELSKSAESKPAILDVRRSLRRCKDNDRALLERHYLEGYTSAELADALHCNSGAVRVRLLRARRRLRGLLNGQDGNGHGEKRDYRFKGPVKADASEDGPRFPQRNSKKPPPAGVHAAAALLLCVFVLFGCGGPQAEVAPEEKGIESAYSILINEEGRRVGAAELTEAAGGVKVDVSVAALPEGQYDFQIHETARCEPPDFASAGAPYPDAEQVGMVTNANPAIKRSLGHIDVGPNGTGQAQAIAPVVSLTPMEENSLFKEGGTSLVVRTTAAGGAEGKRVACGPIQHARPDEVEQTPPGDLESAEHPDQTGTPGIEYRNPQGR